MGRFGGKKINFEFTLGPGLVNLPQDGDKKLLVVDFAALAALKIGGFCRSCPSKNGEVGSKI